MTRYIAYDPYRAGVNNVRINFELVAALAHVTDRTLVMPELLMSREREHHQADGTFIPYHPATFLDIDDLPSVPETALPARLTEHMVPPIPNRDASVLVLEDGPDRDAFLAGRQAVWLDGNVAETDVIRLPEIICPFYAEIYTNPTDRCRMARFVRQRVRHPLKVAEVAEECSAGLGKFHAAVVRRNEFHHFYREADIPAEAIANVLAEVVPGGATLLLATDEPNRYDFFGPLARRWAVVFTRDLVSKAAPWLKQPLLGCVEQNLCALGETFTGTRLSTFSAYVDRLRFYSRRNEKPRFTDGTHNHIDDAEGAPLFSWQPTMRRTTAIWGREFREGGDWSYERVEELA